MLTHVHKCGDTLVLAHESKGRSWGSFRAARSGRTLPVWGRTRPSWGTGLRNTNHLESGVFCPVRSLLGENSLSLRQVHTRRVRCKFFVRSSLSLCPVHTGCVRCVRPVWRPVFAQDCVAPWVWVRCTPDASGFFKSESPVPCQCQRQRLLF